MDGFGIVGSWVASFSIGGVNITDQTGFESFKIVEEAGNQLPTFELIFRTTDAGLLSFINEGNVISAGMGVTQINLTTNLRPMSKDISRADSSSLRFHITGFYDAIDYLANTKTSTTDEISSLEAMQAITSQHFTNDYSTSSANDKMNWCQHGIPNQSMVEHLWQHADLGSGNFPMIGITSDGTFRLRTASDLTSGNYQWNFTNAEQLGGSTVPFHYDYNIKSDTGFTNIVAAYQKSADIVDLDKGPGSIFTTNPVGLFGQSSSLEQSSSIAAGAAGALLSNINHHTNFNQAKADNVTNLANASSTKLNVSNSDYFFPIKLLDVIMFTDFLEDASSVQSFSGLWVVTEVSRSIEEGKFHTQITATRESMNNVQISS